MMVWIANNGLQWGPKTTKNCKKNGCSLIFVFLIIYNGFKKFWGLQEAPKYHTDRFGHSKGRIDFPKHQTFFNIHVLGNFNVLEMTQKTFHFVRCLLRTSIFQSDAFGNEFVTFLIFKICKFETLKFAIFGTLRLYNLKLLK